MNITINLLELASELAHKRLIENWKESIEIYQDESAIITNYTEKAQDIFNDYYDMYIDLINSCKSI
jgi:hypothetical protein